MVIIFEIEKIKFAGKIKKLAVKKYVQIVRI